MFFEKSMVTGGETLSSAAGEECSEESTLTQN